MVGRRSFLLTRNQKICYRVMRSDPSVEIHVLSMEKTLPSGRNKTLAGQETWFVGLQNEKGYLNVYKIHEFSKIHQGNFMYFWRFVRWYVGKVCMKKGNVFLISEPIPQQSCVDLLTCFKAQSEENNRYWGMPKPWSGEIIIAARYAYINPVFLDPE